ncbi:hypothetical protein [Fluviicola taffensis]|uniref:Uncharacterized protein n=1 Tax=Fluviicola taffensis (strain DSM 16823 / NCIMB 13979 / RW262) TaxID=755732 RepID=F2IEL7_FLUTR|nr:hypothetical protein [Fluviicola taffensis]AEA44556.1 hypothetical protein Fluta_2572 [Fluviicola taffensis DSM 16823]
MTKYSFENYREISIENYKELSDVFQKEMQKIAKSDSFYSNDGSIESFMGSCKAEFTNDSNLDLYDVVLTDHPEVVIYHFWKYFDEYGSLFYADSGEDVGVGMMDFNFVLTEGSIEQLKLCKELHESFYQDEALLPRINSWSE